LFIFTQKQCGGGGGGGGFDVDVEWCDVQKVMNCKNLIEPLTV